MLDIEGEEGVDREVGEVEVDVDVDEAETTNEEMKRYMPGS